VTRDIRIAEKSNRAIPKAMSDVDDPETYYDANGNLKRLEHLSVVRWSYRNHISSVDVVARDGDSPTANIYVYDSGGMRSRKVAERNRGGGVIEIEEKIYLGATQIKRVWQRKAGVDAKSLERFTTHVMDDKQRVAIVHRWTPRRRQTRNGRAGESVRCQLNNHLGSASLELTDGSADIISYEEYFLTAGRR